MSIERDSTGLPQADIRRRTTKVNFSIVMAVALFLAAMFAIVWWFATSRP